VRERRVLLLETAWEAMRERVVQRLEVASEAVRLVEVVWRWLALRGSLVLRGWLLQRLEVLQLEFLLERVGFAPAPIPAPQPFLIESLV
jgi:hypothetical protein